MKNHNISLSNFYKYALASFIIIVFISGIIASYLYRNIRLQQRSTFQSRIQSQIATLNKTYESLETSLISELLNNEYIQVLNTTEDPYKYNSAVILLREGLEQYNSYYTTAYNFYYYSSDLEEFVMPSLSNYSTFLDIKQTVITFLSESCPNNNGIDNQWHLVQSASGEWYIIRAYQYETDFLGCCLSVESLFNTLGVNNYSSAGEYLLLVQNNKISAPSNISGDLFSYDIPVSATNRNCDINNYVLSWFASYHGDYSYVFVLDTFIHLRSLVLPIAILLSSLLILLLSGILLLSYIRKSIMKPLDSFIKNMNMDSVENSSFIQFNEIRQVNELYKSARSQIENLKIEKYEMEIKKNFLETEYLLLQIRPHFYLNCMNIIYNMAQTGHISEIQALSMEVSDYLRSFFRQGNVPVTLRQELNHVQKYLNINSIRYHGEFTSDIEISDKLLDYRILPLILHTLVENCIKHALQYDNDTLLSIMISVSEETLSTPTDIQCDKYLLLSVSDNGSGFPDDILEKLNSQEDIRTADGKHIGIYNIINRINYYYHSEAKIVFSNLPDGGAHIQIWIPQKYALPDNRQED